MSEDELYEYLGQTFEWDSAKASKNFLSHRVLFTEAATAFFDENALYFKDEDHSEMRNDILSLGGLEEIGRYLLSMYIVAYAFALSVQDV